MKTYIIEKERFPVINNHSGDTERRFLVKIEN